MLRFACPFCQKTLAAPEEKGGAQTTCPGCRKPVQVPMPSLAVAPAAVIESNTIPPVTPPTPATSQRTSWWKKALSEVGLVFSSTAAQTLRLFGYGWDRCRLLQGNRRAAASQIALAQQAIAAQTGPAELRRGVADIDRQIESTQAAGGKTHPLKAQRAQALSALGEALVLQSNAPPAVEMQWQRARSAQLSLEKQKTESREKQARLVPVGLAGWLRVLAGYGMVFVLLLLTFAILRPQRGNVDLPISAGAVVDKAPVVDIQATGETLVVQEPPRLMLDPEGHTTFVRRLAFTPDGRYLVTASRDKTARVWDVATGETIRVIRLWVGENQEGVVLSVAISPDGKTVALGGAQVMGEKLGCGVFLVDLVSGKVDKVFKGHGDTITSLAFSPDGKLLASGGPDRVMAIWNIATGKTEKTMRNHPGSVKDIAFSPDGQRVLVGSEDGICSIWWIGEKVRETRLISDAPLTAAAWSPDGQTIVTGQRGGAIGIWEPSGKLIKKYTGLRCDVITSVSVTRDGSEAIYTSIGEDGGCGVINLAAGQIRLRQPFHSKATLFGALSPDGKLVASTGGVATETLLWRVSDGAIVNEFVGKGISKGRVGWSPDGRAITWASIQHGGTTETPTRTFDLGSLQFGPRPSRNFIGDQTVRGDYRLVITPEGYLAIQHVAKQVTVRLYKPENAKDRVLAAGFLLDGRVVVGQTYQNFLWDPEHNKVVGEFTGTVGQLESISPSPTSPYFLTGANDQTVRIWHPEKNKPILSFFFTDQDWVAWTEEGVYSASPGGERLIGWHVNNGREREASFYPAAQFRRSLYHPDVISKLLDSGSLEKAFAQVGKPYTPGLNVANVLPPTVAITSPAGLGVVAVDKSQFEIKATARSVGKYPVTRAQLLVDGRPYRGIEGAKAIAQPRLGELQLSWTVDLPPGVHLLSVVADNSVSRALSPVVEVAVVGQSPGPPNLYVLAVGINDYPGPLKLNFAAPDADALAQAFQRQQGKQYGKVEVKLIKDRDATRQGIEQGLAWLASKMTHRDVGIVSFSGHGDRDPRGNFFLIPVDVNVRDIPGSCVSGDSLKTRLREMPGRIITLLDACHSGAAGESQRRGEQTDDLVRDLISEDYGIVVMSSSRGHEYSLESPSVKHGFFTLAVLEGLEGRADFNHDGSIQLTEIDRYTLNRVRELSDGRQTPVLSRPRTIRSFALAQP